MRAAYCLQRLDQLLLIPGGNHAGVTSVLNTDNGLQWQLGLRTLICDVMYHGVEGPGQTRSPLMFRWVPCM